MCREKDSLYMIECGSLKSIKIDIKDNGNGKALLFGLVWAYIYQYVSNGEHI